MSKTISIRDDVVEKLQSRKKEGQSFSGVILELFKELEGCDIKNVRG